MSTILHRIHQFDHPFDHHLTIHLTRQALPLCRQCSTGSAQSSCSARELRSVTAETLSTNNHHARTAPERTAGWSAAPAAEAHSEPWTRRASARCRSAPLGGWQCNLCPKGSFCCMEHYPGLSRVDFIAIIASTPQESFCCMGATHDCLHGSTCLHGILECSLH